MANQQQNPIEQVLTPEQIQLIEERAASWAEWKTPETLWTLQLLAQSFETPLTDKQADLIDEVMADRFIWERAQVIINRQWEALAETLSTLNDNPVAHVAHRVALWRHQKAVWLACSNTIALMG